MNLHLSRRTLFQATGIAALAGAGVGLVSCSSPAADPAGTAPTPQSARPRTLRLEAGEAGYPSPFGMTHGGYLQMILLFDTLVWCDAENIENWLAEKVEMAPDGSKCTVTLREGLTWSDGEPVTAEDVAFSMMYQQEHPLAWFIDMFMFESVTAVDDLVCEMNLRPYAGFERNVLAAAPIVPKHIWQGVAEPEKKQDADALVGTGAYTLESHDLSAGTYQFAARDDYFLGRPYIDTVEFVPAGEPLVAVRNGELSLASADTGTPADTLAEFEADPDTYGMVSAGGAQGTAFYMNLATEPFNDVDVRRAVMHALDRKQYVEQIQNGQGAQGNPGYLPAENQFYADMSDKGEYDLETANDLMAGRTFEIDLLCNQQSARGAEWVKTQLAGIGITATVRALENTAMREAGQAGDYTGAVMGFGGLQADPSFILGLLDKTAKNNPFNKVRDWDNDRYVELNAQQQTAIDVEERQELITEMQELIADEVPLVMLAYGLRTTVFRNDPINSWFYTPYGYGSGSPMVTNKTLIVTGQTTGTAILQ